MDYPMQELRRICQESRESDFYQVDWFQRYFLSPISIYITKLFLKTGISANQATLIAFLAGIAGATLLISANPKLWILGALLFYLFMVLDCVDGEIARYRGTASAFGGYLDSITGFLVWVYILICMSFGIYNALHEVTALMIGFGAAILLSLGTILVLEPYRVLHKEGTLAAALGPNNEERHKKPFLTRLGSLLFGAQPLFLGILLVAIIDCFISPFTISFIPFIDSFSARYIYLIIYALATLANVILRFYTTSRHGVKVQY